MARIIVKESVIPGKTFFNGVMTFDDVQDMVERIGIVDGKIYVSKGTYHLHFTHNMHYVSFTKDKIYYSINLTEKQFKKMISVFKEMGELKINEYFWLN